jgi:hypothetical protein
MKIFVARAFISIILSFSILSIQAEGLKTQQARTHNQTVNSFSISDFARVIRSF